MHSDQDAKDACVSFAGAAELQLETAGDQPAQAGSASGSGIIAVIDGRTLGREVLARALEMADGRRTIRSFSDIDEWSIDEARYETAAILLGIGGAAGDDPNVMDDLRRLAQRHPDIPVIVTGDGEEAVQMLAILSCGARGYVPTSVSLSVAVGALSLVMAGGVFVPASTLPGTGGPDRRRSADPGIRFGLTERQWVIAEGISRGKPNKIIAYELNLCESTVKVHIRSIMKKLQARNRTEVAFRLHAARP
ncbi:response regulator transcription factor [Inquilinus limosus]|uniref:response regulator transcription factor n=1 Tax=Inquilinus limosus TaxID=171674 RepID=UPI000684D875|nr:response regulator transcription factor [Inquilinus limosus]